RSGFTSEADYLRIITQKTASFMSACCRIGALLGGLPSGQVEALTRYGLDIGVAFQISDDALDFVADQDRLGKAIGADLREGKRTLPLIVMLERLALPEAERVRALLRRPGLVPAEIEEIRRLVVEHEGVECARAHTPTRRPRRPTSRGFHRRRSARRSRSWRISSWTGTADGRRSDGLDAIVTLTTDFGVRDPWVAEMKGAILGIARTAGRAVQLVDVTHEVARHDVVEGALALEAAAPFFPRGTVHLAVIDPGVGTARRGIAIAAGDQVFVGPDNGVFTPFLSGTGWR